MGYNMLQMEYSRGEFNRTPQLIRKSPALKMPVDFTSYLLSSSPPGFDFYTLRDRSSGAGKGGISSKRVPCSAVRSLIQRSQSDLCLASRAGSQSDSCLTSRAGSQDDLPSVNISNSDGEICNKRPSFNLSQSSPRLSDKKSVSFADEKGHSLIQVRVMTEPSCAPPRLRSEVLAGLTHGAAAEATTCTSPALTLAFQQPASDYLGFRERLERDSVSLENVIVKDYNLMGTVKVKNIAFEKAVKVRVTFDGWESFRDISAHFIHAPQSSSGQLHSPYDTFSFQIDVPPNFDVKKSVEFAVCYDADNRQYWDSNYGENYTVRSAGWTNHKDHKPESIFSLGLDTDWTDYSSWSSLDCSLPFY